MKGRERGKRNEREWGERKEEKTEGENRINIGEASKSQGKMGSRKTVKVSG